MAALDATEAVLTVTARYPCVHSSSVFNGGTVPVTIKGGTTCSAPAKLDRDVGITLSQAELTLW